MPSTGPRTCHNRILRDYLLAALRGAPGPLSTTELRRGAPAVPAAGSPRPLPPTRETIYRLLRSLHNQGAVAPADTASTWIATPQAAAAAAAEIAMLDALLAAPSAHPHPRRVDPCRRQHRR